VLTRDRRSRTQAEQGMVTAELAVATLAAAVLMIMLCWGIFLITIQLRCIDTAAAVARQTARGDTAAVVAARSRAPRGAVIEVSKTPTLVRVDVRVSVRPFRWATGAGANSGHDFGSGLGSVDVHANAQVVPEPGA
jgi:hypothetical protein